MTLRENYVPGPASGAHINKDGAQWALVVTRELRHSPEKVWEAITDPAQLKEWAPFNTDGNMDRAGATVKLTTVGAPVHLESETRITRAEAPRLLEYSWGGNDMRLVLEPVERGGTRLTLWHNIDRRFIAMGAAGWHLCFDVLDHLLAGDPIGRIVGGDAMKIEGFQRLHAEYAKQFGIEMPNLKGRTE